MRVWHTTSICILGNGVERCSTSSETAQIYHSDGFALFFDRCRTNVYGTYGSIVSCVEVGKLRKLSTKVEAIHSHFEHYNLLPNSYKLPNILFGIAIYVKKHNGIKMT